MKTATTKTGKPFNKAAEIKDLMARLEKASDSKAKRTIRAALRRLGHKGGLGKVKKAAPKKAVKTVKKSNKAA